jgi:hypothetical protein
MTANLPYGEDVNYWQTSRSSPDVWIDRTKKQIEKLGGTVLAEGYGSEPTSGRSAYMLAFQIGNDNYKVMWPVLPTKSGNEKAARIQAVTMLYHDVKAKCITAHVLGARSAFFSYMLLPDGRTAAEASAPELLQAIPSLFAPEHPQLPGNDVVDGDYSLID